MSDAFEKANYLIRVFGKVTGASLAKELNISRQAAAKRLKKMAQRGQLKKLGANRAVKYVAVTAEKSDRYSASFWTRLAARVPATLRVQLGKPGVTLRLRLQAKFAVAHVEPEHAFVFLDFAGVDDAGDEFLDELLRVEGNRTCAEFMPINVSDALRKKIARVKSWGSSFAPDPEDELYT